MALAYVSALSQGQDLERLHTETWGSVSIKIVFLIRVNNVEGCNEIFICKVQMKATGSPT